MTKSASGKAAIALLLGGALAAGVAYKMTRGQAAKLPTAETPASKPNTAAAPDLHAATAPAAVAPDLHAPAANDSETVIVPTPLSAQALQRSFYPKVTIPSAGAQWQPPGISDTVTMFAAGTYPVGFVDGWLFTPTNYGYYLIRDLASNHYIGTQLM